MSKKTPKILSAQEARTALQRAELQHDHGERVRRIHERREAAKARKRIIEQDLPLRWKEFEKELAQAIRNRCSAFKFYVNHEVEAEEMRLPLTERGYRVGQLESSRGESNMGDFNAPCVVAWERLWFRVTIPNGE